MTNGASYTLAGLRDFLRQAGTEGLMNPAAARARHKAVEQLADELTGDERADIRKIDVDALARRFHKLEGSSIRPETLAIYRERFASALESYLSWLADPASFIKPRRERARAFMRGDDANPALEPRQRAAERIALESTENPSNIVPVPLRDGLVVYVANLPLDLTGDEAERIARVVSAYAQRGDKDA